MRTLPVVLFCVLALGGCSMLRGPAPPLDPLAVHREALVVDLHSDTPLRLVRGFDIAELHADGHMDLPRLAAGGVDLQVFACFLSTHYPADSCRWRVDTMIDSLTAQVRRNPERVAICTTAQEASRIMESGRLAVFIGIENGVALENDLANLDHFYRRGVRYLTLTHTASSDWCISSADALPAFAGLTAFGQAVVRRMNELGMIVDVSHAHPLAVEAALEISSDPIIASHSCVHAFCAHDRNLTDEQIRAIARGGGMIGINFYERYLSQAWNDLAEALKEKHAAEIDSLKTAYEDNEKGLRAAYMPIRETMIRQLDRIRVDVGTVADHIDYIVELVGPDHVGLGSDYDGVNSLPEGLKDCSMLPNLTAELLQRGYSVKDVRKILGGNFIRVFREVCD